jgi:hypothetical protein
MAGGLVRPQAGELFRAGIECIHHSPFIEGDHGTIEAITKNADEIQAVILAFRNCDWNIYRHKGQLVMCDWQIPPTAPNW